MPSPSTFALFCFVCVWCCRCEFCATVFCSCFCVCIFLFDFFTFSVNDFYFTFIKQLRSTSAQTFCHLDTHIGTDTHAHTYILAHTHRVANVGRLLSFTVWLFCFLLISFYVARSPPFGVQMPPKLQSNAVFISSTGSSFHNVTLSHTLSTIKLPHATSASTALPLLAAVC